MLAQRVAEIAHSETGIGFWGISDLGYRSLVFAAVRRVEAGVECERNAGRSEETAAVIEIEEEDV
jgi:hypothetical protein